MPQDLEDLNQVDSVSGGNFSFDPAGFKKPAVLIVGGDGKNIVGEFVRVFAIFVEGKKSGGSDEFNIGVGSKVRVLGQGLSNFDYITVRSEQKKQAVIDEVFFADNQITFVIPSIFVKIFGKDEFLWLEFGQKADPRKAFRLSRYLIFEGATARESSDEKKQSVKQQNLTSDEKPKAIKSQQTGVGGVVEGALSDVAQGFLGKSGFERNIQQNTQQNKTVSRQPNLKKILNAGIESVDNLPQDDSSAFETNLKASVDAEINSQATRTETTESLRVGSDFTPIVSQNVNLEQASVNTGSAGIPPLGQNVSVETQIKAKNNLATLIEVPTSASQIDAEVQGQSIGQASFNSRPAIQATVDGPISQVPNVFVSKGAGSLDGQLTSSSKLSASGKVAEQPIQAGLGVNMNMLPMEVKAEQAAEPELEENISGQISDLSQKDSLAAALDGPQKGFRTDSEQVSLKTPSANQDQPQAHKHNKPPVDKKSESPDYPKEKAEEKTSQNKTLNGVQNKQKENNQVGKKTDLDPETEEKKSDKNSLPKTGIEVPGPESVLESRDLGVKMRNQQPGKDFAGLKNRLQANDIAFKGKSRPFRVVSGKKITDKEFLGGAASKPKPLNLDRQPVKTKSDTTDIGQTTPNNKELVENKQDKPGISEREKPKQDNSELEDRNLLTDPRTTGELMSQALKGDLSADRAVLPTIRRIIEKKNFLAGKGLSQASAKIWHYGFGISAGTFFSGFDFFLGALVMDAYWIFGHRQNPKLFPMKTWQKVLTIFANVMPFIYVILTLVLIIMAGCNSPEPIKSVFIKATGGSISESVSGGGICTYFNYKNLESVITGRVENITPSGLLSTGSWTAAINSSVQKYPNVPGCMLRVVIQKESAGQADVIGCDCAYNGQPQFCPNNKQSNKYFPGFPFDWEHCSYGVGLTQWTIFQRRYASIPNDFRRWQSASFPSRTPFGTQFYGVDDFLNPQLSLDLTAEKFSRDLAKNPGDIAGAFAAYVGASSSQQRFVQERMALYNMCISNTQ